MVRFENQTFVESFVNNKTMEMRYAGDERRNVTFREGMTQITSAGLNSLRLPFDQISLDNSDINFIYNNLVNGPLAFIL